MYLGIDIGATKTLVASLDNNGVIHESFKIPTAEKYEDFLQDLAEVVAKLSTKEYRACGVGVPGRLDREKGIGIAMGNLPWRNVPIKADVEELLHCPVVIENDAKLAGLSEAMLLKDQYNSVVYATISTGIGVAVILNQKIHPLLADTEAGKMPVEFQGKMVPWESFASGRAIVRRYGQSASQITSDTTWRHIAHDIAVGLIDVIAVLQPEVIVLGGSVASYFDHFEKFLKQELHKFEVPLIPIPPIIHAARPHQAVVYGCYDLAKANYGRTR